MNYVVISGKIAGEPKQEINSEGSLVVKFKIRSEYYSQYNGVKHNTLIDCIAYRGIARYCNNEIYNSADVIVTGRLINRHYILDNDTHYNKQFVSCTHVARLDQNEYLD